MSKKVSKEEIMANGEIAKAVPHYSLGIWIPHEKGYIFEDRLYDKERGVYIAMGGFIPHSVKQLEATLFWANASLTDRFIKRGCLGKDDICVYSKNKA